VPYKVKNKMPQLKPVKRLLDIVLTFFADKIHDSAKVTLIKNYFSFSYNDFKIKFIK